MAGNPPIGLAITLAILRRTRESWVTVRDEAKQEAP